MLYFIVVVSLFSYYVEFGMVSVFLSCGIVEVVDGVHH